MKFKIVLIIVLLIFTVLVLATETIRLEGLADPRSIHVDDKGIYIVDRDKIHLYSMDHFTLVKTFGNKGEGPGEYKYYPILTLLPDRLMAASFEKILWYSRKGEFIKEKKMLNQDIMAPVPLGDTYVALKSTLDNKTREFTNSISIYDNEFNPLKELYRWKRKNRQSPSGKLNFEIIKGYTWYVTNGDIILLGDTAKGFYITVFNRKGESLYQIQKEYEKQEITDAQKTQRTEWLMKKPAFKRLKSRMEIVFPDYFPAFFDIKIDSNRLYISTYRVKDNQKEIIIMDMKGNVLKTAYLPQYVRYAVHDGRFYYLKEHEADEEWDLIIPEI